MDNLTKIQRQKNMRNIRSFGTIPEEIIARGLRRQKVYFARNVRSITGKPDFVFRRKKIAVFVDSDFWHGHRDRFIMPKTNGAYWREKIIRNKQRDRRVNSELRKQKWRVIRLWEFNIKKNPSACIQKILRAITR
jgi:DNA mismatch endonuclease Vsr